MGFKLTDLAFTNPITAPIGLYGRRNDISKFFGGGGGGIQAPDISGELPKISALFEQARNASTASINRQAAQGRSPAANNLAARGIYSSPVSQNTFSQLEQGRLGAISDMTGRLASEEAGTRAQLLNSLLGLNFNAQQLNRQRSDATRNALFGGAGGLLQTFLLARMLNPGTAAASTAVNILPYLLRGWQGAPNPAFGG